jgi:transketolase
VAEVLVKNRPVPVEMVGIQDQFGEVGPEDYLRGRFNLNAVDIAAAALRVLERK